MEFWKTDEIAPVVLIILFELLVLGLINYTMQVHDSRFTQEDFVHNAGRGEARGFLQWLTRG